MNRVVVLVLSVATVVLHHGCTSTLCDEVRGSGWYSSNAPNDGPRCAVFCEDDRFFSAFTTCDKIDDPNFEGWVRYTCDDELVSLFFLQERGGDSYQAESLEGDTLTVSSRPSIAYDRVTMRFERNNEAISLCDDPNRKEMTRDDDPLGEQGMHGDGPFGDVEEVE